MWPDYEDTLLLALEVGQNPGIGQAHCYSYYKVSHVVYSSDGRDRWQADSNTPSHHELQKTRHDKSHSDLLAELAKHGSQQAWHRVFGEHTVECSAHSGSKPLRATFGCAAVTIRVL